ncbi:SDR family oxidoreductase [Kitasatospora sp. NPDC008050]|uniref:SDR family oxidoreductase n=1 Tax=Kitasatospora sp. NPDC008050 TaxID=3364021 RepID=UPI0036E4C9D9
MADLYHGHTGPVGGRRVDAAFDSGDPELMERYRRSAAQHLHVLAVVFGNAAAADESADTRTACGARDLDGDYADGYAASKWAGEVLLREAHEAFGLPVAVFRSNMILAHPRYRGQLNVPDVFTRLVLSLLATGTAPGSFYTRGTGESRGHFDALPVDFTARAITSLGEHPPPVTGPDHQVRGRSPGAPPAMTQPATAAGPAISRALRPLEAQGYVTITVDPAHRRRRLVALTAMGQDTFLAEGKPLEEELRILQGCSCSAALLAGREETCAGERAMHRRCHRAGNGSCFAGSGTRLTARPRSGRPAF